MIYNQVQSFQINDYANHYVGIKITGYRELYSKNCKQQCVHVYNIFVCCLHKLLYQEIMLAITQLCKTCQIPYCFQTLLRAHTKPTCVIKPGSIHRLYQYST